MKSDSLRITTATSPVSALRRYCKRLLQSSPARKQLPHRGGCASKDEELHRRVFRYFDANGDGKISAAELQSRMGLVGGGGDHQLSEEEAEMVVRLSDSDGDGMLGLEDFAKLMDGGEAEDKVEAMREAFQMYSASGKSTITPRSLKRMLSRLGQPATVDQCEAMITRFDLNGDGVLDFEEFRTMMGADRVNSNLFF